MWSLTSPRTNRISDLQNFRTSPEKDFCNNIDPKRTSTISNRLPVKSRTVRDFAQKVMAIAVLGCFHVSGGSANEASRFHRALGWCNGDLAAGAQTSPKIPWVGYIAGSGFGRKITALAEQPPRLPPQSPAALPDRASSGGHQPDEIGRGRAARP